jgi:hypothetical protein
MPILECLEGLIAPSGPVTRLLLTDNRCAA